MWRTFLLNNFATVMANITLFVDLPTPPFWLLSAMTFVTFNTPHKYTFADKPIIQQYNDISSTNEKKYTNTKVYFCKNPLLY
ncbi:hypothetical protein KB1253_19950 [Lactiplantibacillus plantarum]|nr:hypothetical protein KB1253_19950 [Lactiplantibacillus plantarum]